MVSIWISVGVKGYYGRRNGMRKSSLNTHQVLSCFANEFYEFQYLTGRCLTRNSIMIGSTCSDPGTKT